MMPNLSPYASYALNLSHPVPYVRARSAGALGEHGSSAIEAVPALLITQKFDPDPEVREQATRALYLIDPQQMCLERRLPDNAYA